MRLDLCDSMKYAKNTFYLKRTKINENSLFSFLHIIVLNISVAIQLLGANPIRKKGVHQSLQAAGWLEQRARFAILKVRFF